MTPNELVGKKHIFTDGASIEVVQVKKRDENQDWVTYHIKYANSLPRKLVMEYGQFIATFGEFFES